MKTVKRIPLGIINISSTPHKNDGSTYVGLFNAIYQLGRQIRIRADTYAMIASCIPLDEKAQHGILTGEIHKFTEIGGDWENLQKRKAASPEDIQQINIPDHLKPNRESFRYFLFPKEHRLVFQLVGEKRSINHSSVQALLETLFSDERIKKKFPLVSVIIEQEPASLERIFKLPQLNYLYIHLERPNPDDLSAAEIRHIERLLAEQGARSYDIELNHAPHESLKPNKENKRMARAATSYGKVVGKGLNEQDRPEEIDTSEHPVAEGFDYNKKAKISLMEQMLRAAYALVQRIKKNEAKSSTDESSIDGRKEN